MSLARLLVFSLMSDCSSPVPNRAVDSSRCLPWCRWRRGTEPPGGPNRISYHRIIPNSCEFDRVFGGSEAVTGALQGPYMLQRTGGELLVVDSQNSQDVGEPEFSRLRFA